MNYQVFDSVFMPACLHMAAADFWGPRPCCWGCFRRSGAKRLRTGSTAADAQTGTRPWWTGTLPRWPPVCRTRTLSSGGTQSCSSASCCCRWGGTTPAAAGGILRAPLARALSYGFISPKLPSFPLLLVLRPYMASARKPYPAQGSLFPRCRLPACTCRNCFLFVSEARKRGLLCWQWNAVTMALHVLLLSRRKPSKGVSVPQLLYLHRWASFLGTNTMILARRC